MASMQPPSATVHVLLQVSPSLPCADGFCEVHTTRAPSLVGRQLLPGRHSASFAHSCPGSSLPTKTLLQLSDGFAGGAAALERRGVDVDARTSSCSVVDQAGVIPVPIDAWSHPVLDLGAAIGRVVRKAGFFTAGADVAAKRVRESAREVIDGDRRSFFATAACDERES